MANTDYQSYYDYATGKGNAAKTTSTSESRQFEIYFDNTTLTNSEKPLFLIREMGKAFSIKGTSVVSKEEVANFSSAKLFIVEDDEIVYSIESIYNNHIFVTCGKNFGTRELNTLASILLKLGDKDTTLHIQTFDRKCPDKRKESQRRYKIHHMQCR